SKWASKIASDFNISTTNNRVDIGIRFECPAAIWNNITDEVYESKIMYRSPKTGCTCRTFCMNPKGYVVNENTNGIVTVNGHSFDSPELESANTNFALLVTHNFTEPFKDSNAYGESIARLCNMLAGGVMVQRFGDLIANKRSNHKRIKESFVTPTLKAEPGNLALAIPKLTLDTIIEMIYALDKLVPGTANYDNLLYGTEVKFYNSVIDVDNNFETKEKGLFIIGDCSGTTHSLSQASAEGVYVARYLMDELRK
ncbi:MAG: FAD-dependent oxidoreductase, partial [Lachnospiraceae bacterium]|nr:FAD-dependent oxidoreductase [Lachnospiraceae bacterium]